MHSTLGRFLTARRFRAGTRHGALVIAVAIGVSVSLFVAAILALTGWAVHQAVRAQVSSRLLGPSGVLAILAFVGLDVGISLAIAFAVQARGLTHPATIGVTVGAVLLALGGPRLMAHLRGQMLARVRTMQ